LLENTLAVVQKVEIEAVLDLDSMDGIPKHKTTEVPSLAAIGGVFVILVYKLCCSLQEPSCTFAKELQKCGGCFHSLLHKYLGQNKRYVNSKGTIMDTIRGRMHMVFQTCNSGSCILPSIHQ
jgi:hypothetical protein